MKTLKIGTKSQANSIIVESLFHAGGTLNVERYDLGKYKADGSFMGREVEVHDGVFALWMETKHDEDGPYKALYCAAKPRS